LHLKINNDTRGFTEFKKWCRANAFSLKETFIVLEYTGGYEYRFIQFCESMSVAYCRISGLEIKRSMGMIRGKNDKVDSFRIGQYGEEKIKRLVPDKPLDTSILLLKQLLSFRKRLVKEAAGLLATVKERKHNYQVNKKDAIIHIAERKIKANDQFILQIEGQIMELIKAIQHYCETTGYCGV
jgi:transposase